METHHLAPGLGDVVVGRHTRALARAQADRVAGGRRVVVAGFRCVHDAHRSGRLFGVVRVIRFASDGRHRGFELALRGSRQTTLRIEDLGQPAQRCLVALHELRLELDEPFDDAPPRDDVDLVEAQLDPRVG